MAVLIGISVSYLSQIENGDRPVSEAVLVTLARDFPADWGSIDAADDTALLVATIEAVDRHQRRRRRARRERVPPRGEAPALARAAARRDARRVSPRAGAVARARRPARGGRRARRGLLPWEDVRDWFHAAGNYVDALDRAAEEIGETLGSDRIAALEARLAARGVVGDDLGALAAPFATMTARPCGSTRRSRARPRASRSRTRSRAASSPNLIADIVAAADMASETARRC